MNERQKTPLRMARWQTYLVAFVITALIFGTALSVSAYINEQRVAEVRAIQDNISTDILSLETQFDLLAELSCGEISENSILSGEISTLANRLAHLEGESSINEGEVRQLKRQYSLLQIKDILLMREVSEKCELEPVFILYFYSNAGDCPDCERQGYVLTELGRQYPNLRIYSFDYHLELPALRTLTSIYEVGDELPTLVIDETAYEGFQSIEDIKEILPELSELEEAEEAATSTDSDPAREQLEI